MVLLQQAQRTLILQLLALDHLIAVVELDEDEGASQGVGGASILTTETDTTIHVTAHLSNVLTDHEAARRLDVGKETREMTETLIEGTAMTGDLSQENMTLTSAQQVPRSLDRVHWTLTVDPANQTPDIFQELPQDQHHIRHITHHRPTG